MIKLFKPSFFGLDISDLSLKIAKLKENSCGFTLSSYGRQNIPENIIIKGEIQKEDELIKIIQSAIATVHGKPLKTKSCVVSLPESKAFIRVIQLPLMNTAETAEAIKWEAEANIPMPLNEIYLDWQIINQDKDNQNILIGALPIILVDSYLNALKKAGLSPICFEIESVATARAIIKNNYSEDPILIVDLGAERISLINFYQSAIYFTASLLFGKNQFSEAITSALSISVKEAEALKNQTGIDKTNKNSALFLSLEPILQDLIKGLQDCCHASEEHIVAGANRSVGPISKIMLCGGGANLIGLPNFIYSKTKIKTELANPWVNILKPKLKNAPELPYEESMAYATALGLALYKPN